MEELRLDAGREGAGDNHERPILRLRFTPQVVWDAVRDVGGGWFLFGLLGHIFPPSGDALSYFDLAGYFFGGSRSMPNAGFIR